MRTATRSSRTRSAAPSMRLKPATLSRAKTRAHKTMVQLKSKLERAYLGSIRNKKAQTLGIAAVVLTALSGLAVWYRIKK